MDAVITLVYGALVFALGFILFVVGIVAGAAILKWAYPDEAAREASLAMRYGGSMTAVLAGPGALFILHYFDVSTWLRAIIG